MVVSERAAFGPPFASMAAAQTAVRSLLEPLEASRVSDGAFARAYARTGDAGRALLKQAIARLYALHGAEPWQPARLTREFSGALKTRVAVRPNDWFVLLLGPEVASPALLLAALLPAVARRIPVVAVVRPRSGRGWPRVLLTALELCGVENVFSPSRQDFRALVAGLDQAGGAGRAVCLGGAAFRGQVRRLEASPGFGAVRHLDAEPSLGLLAAPDAEWNLDALRLAHPTATFAVYGLGPAETLDSQCAPSPGPSGPASLNLAPSPGPADPDLGPAPGPVPTSLPAGATTVFAPAPGGFEALRAARIDAAFVPAGAGPVLAPLALAPGLELFWRFVHAAPDLYDTRSETFEPHAG